MEVPGSNHDKETECPDVFNGFPQFLWSNARILP